MVKPVSKPFLVAVFYNLQRLQFDGPGYRGLDVEDIFIKYAAQQNIDLTGALDEYPASVEKDIAIIVCDKGHRKQFAFSLADRKPVAYFKRGVHQLIFVYQDALSVRIVESDLIGADRGHGCHISFPIDIIT